MRFLFTNLMNPNRLTKFIEFIFVTFAKITNASILWQTTRTGGQHQLKMKTDSS